MFANFAPHALALSLLGILSATLEAQDKKHDQDPELRRTAAVALKRILPKQEKKKAAARLRGKIVDAATGRLLPARIYLQNAGGKWRFAQTDAKDGTAVAYRKQRGKDGKSIEMHTTLSAHPFAAELPPGTYTVTVQRGKEYFRLTKKIEIGEQDLEETFRLRRWINMAKRGWYSGDTHVHRSLAELPNVAAAEDLNVSLPLVYWVTQAFQPPGASERSPSGKSPSKLIRIDATHVIYPRNTEYEIFTVDGKRHALGAVFVLGHRSVLKRGVPPLAEVARAAHAEGALLELDKHNWPWSMAIVPIMKVDLYELSNNHVWRTNFYFRKFGESPAEYMHIEQDERGMTERGWIDFGFQNYYALLNCGFRLRPTAGTASGVHPVPLGFGRVYVHLPGGFNYAAWMKGLNAGRSFVTTGPMLMVQVNGQPPGHTFKLKPDGAKTFRLQGTAISPSPLSRIEIVSAGRVVRTLEPANKKTKDGGLESPIDVSLKIDRSTWLAVRCYQSVEGGRVRFAHSSPVHIDIEGKPLRPRRAEVEYLIHRVQTQIDRSRGVLPESAINEYRQALKAYQQIAKTAAP